jgi:tryptophan halogenase
MKNEDALDSSPTALISPFMDNHERSYFLAHRPNPAAVAAAEPEPYRRIGIIGGGTAGFLVALALRARLPHLDITLIESSSIPIIGVGEATTPHIIPFLHNICKIDMLDFYQNVRPTWKLGIKFEWGKPDMSHFLAPFDWDENSVGMVGSLRYDGNINAMTITSLFMDQQRAPILTNEDGGITSLLPYISHAYHLENRRLVSYLHKVADSRGVKHLDRKITDVVLTPDGEQVDHVVTDQGENLSFDLFIDCSGFRSLLLDQKLKTPFVSYASTLYTDRALTFSTPHDGKIKPYTTATTMNSGWTWTIPHEERDNHGYVFSSAFCSPDEAEREARARWPRMNEVSDVVSFRSGRHEAGWRGNVVAIGNAHAFVEPLESTGLLMICLTIQKLVSIFPRSKRDDSARMLLNSFLAQKWDGLRWFIGVHYKFNRRLDTPFWQEVRANADVSGAELLLRAYESSAPLICYDEEVSRILWGSGIPAICGVSGYDCLLLGQGVPTRLLDVTEPREAWEKRKQFGVELAKRGIDHARALALVKERPELLHQELTAPGNYSRRNFPAAMR